MQYEPYVPLDNLLAFIFCRRLWTDSKNDNSPRSDNAQARIGQNGRQRHQTARIKEMGFDNNCEYYISQLCHMSQVDVAERFVYMC